MHFFKLLAALLLSSTLLTACGGGGAEIHSSSTTLGQELIDLEASYKKGIISEDEYKDMKEAIMDRYN